MQICYDKMTWAVSGLMIRNLLSERFGMTFHWETREMPVFELVVAKEKTRLPDLWD